jgi:hypothetical protein
MNLFIIYYVILFYKPNKQSNIYFLIYIVVTPKRYSEIHRYQNISFQCKKRNYHQNRIDNLDLKAKVLLALAFVTARAKFGKDKCRLEP